MHSFFESTPFLLLLVIGSYIIGQYIYRKSKVTLLHPVIISMVLIIVFLGWSDVSYAAFAKGTSIINFMLGPTVVALGVILYEQLDAIKGNMVSMLTAIFVGSVVGILSVILLGYLFSIDVAVIRSIEPKSVTTPIAMGLSESIGGISSLTVVTVIVCGIIGAVMGPALLKFIGIKSKVAKGLSMGAAAHGLGTAKAMEMGAIEGAISGLSIGLMGIMTSIVLPIIHLFFE